MKRIIKLALAGVAAGALAVSLGGMDPAFAQMKEKEKTVNVGGAPMYPSKNIVQNAVNSKDHTTLVAA
ncbi:MAG: fasciclin domain-containing protein, partial [Pseudolabrys sp.]